MPPWSARASPARQATPASMTTAAARARTFVSSPLDENTFMARSPYFRISERIDVVGDRDLPQQHLADDMRGPDVFGEDRGFPGAPGRQPIRERLVIEPDADGERRGVDRLRRDGESGCLHLAGGDCLQHALDLAGIDAAGDEFERDLHRL